MIRLEKIYKSYPQGIFRSKTINVLNNISISVSSNEVFGIIGPNGAGKSTLLKILMGFIKADRGESFINGIPSSNPACHKFLGFLPEHPTLFSNLTPYEHLAFAYGLQKMNEAKPLKSEIKNVLDIVDLGHVINTPIKRFSKGMQQRTALAYALLFTPQILILDEPMSGLDPIGRQLVIDILWDYKQKGTTIIFCSHILSDVERICDRIAVLNKGQISAIIEPKELDDLNLPISASRTPLESFFLSQILGDSHGATTFHNSV